MSPKQVIAFLLGASLSAAVATVLWWRSDSSPERLRTTLLEKPEFLADHPEILEAAHAVLQTRMLAAQGAERAALIRGKWQELIHVAFTPTIGSPDAPSVLLEFTDYTCEPCRKSAPALSEALNRRSDVRVAVLLLPIGGALSEYAARVAWAAYRQSPQRFPELHHRLMTLAARLSQDSILATMRDLGFDVEQVEREAASPESRSYFEQVRAFAEDLHISGVPAFALNGQLILGGVTAERLKTLFLTARVMPSAQGGGEADVRRTFSLIDQQRRPITHNTFRGEWLIVFFGFTHCPDFCPTTLVRVSQALAKLGASARNMRVLFITVDPERDTPEVLERYLQPFGPKFIGATGSVQQIEATTRAFRTYSHKEPAFSDGTYAVSHSTQLYVLSPDGRLSRQLSSQTKPEQLAATLRTLISSVELSTAQLRGEGSRWISITTTH